MNRFADKQKGFILCLEYNSLKTKFVYNTFFIILAVMSLSCLLPVLWVLVSAFKSADEFFSISPTLIPHSFQPHKIIDVWNMTDFPLAYLNSAIMTLGCIVCGIVFNGLAGYVISRLKPKGIWLVSSMIFWTMMMPTTVATVPLYMTFVNFPLTHWNLTNTYFPMWIMSGANAFNVLLYKSFFDSISHTYIEAAQIDGCGKIRIFFKIIVPMSIPVITTVLIFTFTGTWGTFFWPYLILKESALRTVGVEMYNLSTKVSQDVYMSALMFSIMPSVIVFILFQKHIMNGVSLGGIKG